MLRSKVNVFDWTSNYLENVVMMDTALKNELKSYSNFLANRTQTRKAEVHRNWGDKIWRTQFGLLDRKKFSVSNAHGLTPVSIGSWVYQVWWAFFFAGSNRLDSLELKKRRNRRYDDEKFLSIWLWKRQWTTRKFFIVNILTPNLS